MRKDLVKCKLGRVLKRAMMEQQANNTAQDKHAKLIELLSLPAHERQAAIASIQISRSAERPYSDEKIALEFPTLCYNPDQACTQGIIQMLKAGQYAMLFTLLDLYELRGLNFRHVCYSDISAIDLVKHFPYGCYAYQKNIQMNEVSNEEWFFHPRRMTMSWLIGNNMYFYDMLNRFNLPPSINESSIILFGELFRTHAKFRGRLLNHTIIKHQLNSLSNLKTLKGVGGFVERINSILRHANPYVTPYTALKYDAGQGRIEELQSIDLLGYDPINLSMDNQGICTDELDFFRSEFVDFGPLPGYKGSSFKLLPSVLRSQLLTMAIVMKRMNTRKGSFKDLLPNIFGYIISSFFRLRKELAAERYFRVKTILEAKTHSEIGGIRDMCFDRFIDESEYSNDERDLRSLIHLVMKIVNHDMGLRIADPKAFGSERLLDRMTTWTRCRPHLKKIQTEMRARKTRCSLRVAAKIYLDDLIERRVSLSTVVSRRTKSSKKKIKV